MSLAVVSLILVAIKLLEKGKPDYTDDDIDHMKKVSSHVKRHLGQGQKNDTEDSKWRYSLIYFSNTTFSLAPPLRHAGRGEPEIELALV